MEAYSNYQENFKTETTEEDLSDGKRSHKLNRQTGGDIKIIQNTITLTENTRKKPIMLKSNGQGQ